MRSLQHTIGDEMKTSLKVFFRNVKFPIKGYHATGRRSLKPYLKPRDISSGKTNQIMNKLNSFGSAEQLENLINQCARKKILSTGDAQRILRQKVELGEFRDLQQVACVPRIGAKKFDAIVQHILRNQV